MKTIPSSNFRSFLLAAAFFSGRGCATHASAAQHAYLIDLNSKTATDLGTLGGDFSFAFGINDEGQVVGYSYTAEHKPHAFITGPDGIGMRDLGTRGGSDSYALASTMRGRWWAILILIQLNISSMPSSPVRMEWA